MGYRTEKERLSLIDRKTHDLCDFVHNLNFQKYWSWIPFRLWKQEQKDKLNKIIFGIVDLASFPIIIEVGDDIAELEKLKRRLDDEETSFPKSKGRTVQRYRGKEISNALKQLQKLNDEQKSTFLHTFLEYVYTGDENSLKEVVSFLSGRKVVSSVSKVCF